MVRPPKVTDRFSLPVDFSRFWHLHWTGLTQRWPQMRLGHRFPQVVTAAVAVEHIAVGT